MNIESVSNSVSQVTKDMPSFPAASSSRGATSGSEGVSVRPPEQNEAQKRQEPSRAEVEKAAQQLTDFVAKNNRPELNFSVDEGTGVRIIKVVDTASREVIRQIPSEEAVQLAQALDKLQGLFVKDKA